MTTVFGPAYLRAPTEEDTQRLMIESEVRGWPGMLGSLDYMHWTWKNCPAGWKGQYKGHCNDPTIILVAVTTKDFSIFHSFFGLSGSHNDLNVLSILPLFSRSTIVDAPACNYLVNGQNYSMDNYLANGVYQSWATLVKTIPRLKG